MRSLARFSVALAGATIAATASAQVAKRPLTQADWDIWKSVGTPALSGDGKWASYTVTPLVGNGQLIVRSTSAPTQYIIERGYVARPNNTPGGARGAGAGAAGGGGGGRGGRGAAAGPFADHGRFVLQSVQPSQAEVEASERAAAANTGRGGRGGRGGNAAGTPGAGGANARTSLVILNLADGKQTVLPSVRSFRAAGENSKWLAYVPGPSDSTAAGAASSDSTAAPPSGATAGRGGRGGRGGGGGSAARLATGSPLVLRDLETGTEEKLEDVVSYTFDDSARVMEYVVGAADSANDGIYLRTLASGKSEPIVTGPANYKGFAFDRDATHFVFVSDRGDRAGVKPRFSVYYGAAGGQPEAVVSPALVPPGMHLADNASVAITRAGTAITFSLAPPEQDTIPADSLVGKANFDLWNYKDPQLQPTQKLNVARDRNRTYEAVYFMDTKKVARLTDDSIPNVLLTPDARAGVASSGVRYDVSSMWGDDGNDIYVVDAVTGARKMIREKSSGAASLSATGKYAMFFDHGQWYSYTLASGKLTDLTTSVHAGPFDQSETNSTPEIPGAVGIAGWVSGDRSVLVYDRWDIWDFDPTGARAPICITDSVGRKNHIQLRIEALDRGDRVIDPAQPLLLSAFNEDTKASGFYRVRIGGGQPPARIVMADAKFGAPVKAKDADEYLVTRGTFVDFPDLYAGASLASLTRISNANPQQKNYNWGTAELVHWTSADGVPLSGILYKPENFDPSKKYPMITYFYEDLSDGLHAYVPPNGRNIINPTHYVSNGYLVFEPDIHYEIGYPGPSAVKSIVPGVEMLLARGYVDPKRLGAQGHSWGGYQTAYLVTQTNLFAAAMAGAPVANMTSAYGGIRWGSGIARAVQYEHGQSRIGKSIWEAPQLYIENSPLFWLDRVKTPLFIMSNDADDAVPWYQGIELFVGLRRLGKEVYLIDYNNDVHNPASRANQKDIAMRMQEFFDNKLKDAPEPDWMRYGIPAVDKGRDQVGGAAMQAGTPAKPPAAGGGG